jgi:hypothetical protein
MPFKNNVLSIWIFKILNTYKYFFHINHNLEFMWFLYEPMKTEFWTKFVQTYEAW